jgi:hypothetical protein
MLKPVYMDETNRYVAISPILKPISTLRLVYSLLRLDVLALKSTFNAC